MKKQNYFLKKRGGNMRMKYSAIVFLLATFLFPCALAWADASSVSLSKEANPFQIEPHGQTRVSLGIQAPSGSPENSPSDVINLVDMSGSMAWFSDILDQSVGDLTSDWQRIKEFDIPGGLSGFEALLQNSSGSYDRYLRLKSPSGIWYGASELNPLCAVYSHLQYSGYEYLKITSSCFEAGTWEAWGKGQPESAMLMIGRPPSRSAAAKSAIKHFISLLPDDYKAGLVSFDSFAWLKQRLILLDSEENRNAFDSKVDSLTPAGGTAIGRGMGTAISGLSPTNGGRSGASKAIVLISDGRETGNSDPLGKAQEAKDAGIKIYTIAIGQADENLLRQIAEITNARYFRAESSNLPSVYEQIAADLAGNAISSGKVTEVLPSYAEYLGNPSMEPASVTHNADGTTAIVWDDINISAGEEKIISFDVKVRQENGIYLVGVSPDSRFEYKDLSGADVLVSFPDAYVQIGEIFAGGGGSLAVYSGLSDWADAVGIANQKADKITSESAVLSWTTDVPAVCKAYYDFEFHADGLNYSFSSDAETSEGSAATSHSIELKGLKDDTNYYWRVFCRVPESDYAGFSEEEKFTTLSSGSVSDLLKKIGTISLIPRKQLDDLVSNLKKLSKKPGDLVALFPSLNSAAKADENSYNSQPSGNHNTVQVNSSKGFFKNLTAAIMNLGLKGWLIIIGIIAVIAIVALLI